MKRPARIVALLPLLSLVPTLGCLPPLGKLGDEDTDGTGATDGQDPTANDSDGDDAPMLPPESDRVGVLQLDDGALDVLFVIDNSGSMGSAQARATQAIAAFAQDAVDSGADLRLGFTTTDNGNPWCNDTNPEAGQLQLSACTSRLGEFIFNGAALVDVSQEACLDLCALGSIAQLPTATHVDDAEAIRPWLEAGPGGSNLDAVSMADAVSCVASPGISGCGFEQPLESMSKALDRSSSQSDPSYGFLRPWARLAVVFVTDEVDCSVDSAWDEIFLSDGNRVFWGDQDAATPTSAVCWNAGVECQGTEPDIGPCVPQNYDVDGNVTDAASSVMVSLTRYIETLQGVDASKQAYRAEGSVSISLIAGVPQGYADGTEELVYTRGANPDPQFVNDFGVDPGCQGPGGTAVPPVRLKALAELFPVGASPSVHSVCGESFAPALDSIGSALATPQLEQSACVPACLADLDPAAAGTQPQCEIILSRGTEAGRESTLLPACDGGDGTEPCYQLQLDEAAPQCAAQGSNANLELVLPMGYTWQGQLTVEAACEPAAEGTC